MALGQTYVLQPGQKTDFIPVLNIDDNWVINTHGQLALAFTNPNALPSVVVRSLNAPVKPVAPTTTYHDYKLSHVPDTPQPVKSVTDPEGNDLNGQTYAGQKIQWHLTTDYSPYKNLSVSRQVLDAAILDDVQDGAFQVDHDAITIQDSFNKDVKDLFTMHHVLSDEGRTEAVQALLDKYGLNPSGEFYLWVAKDPEAYFQNYMRTNNNITVTCQQRFW